MRPIAPRIDGVPEITVAEDQPEYLPITVALIPRSGSTRLLLSRYTFTAEERKRIAEGADVYFGQLNFNGPMTPQVAGLREAFSTEPER